MIRAELPEVPSRPPDDAGGRAVSVPLVLESDRDCPWPQPVTVGLPLPRGVLRDPGAVRLAGPAGGVPVQALPLARWSDGSVKWLLLDFLAQGTLAGTNRWSATVAGGPVVQPAPPFRLAESPAGVEVDTGVAAFVLGRELLPFAQVRVGGEEVLDAVPGGALLTGAGGARRAPRVERVAVEAGGPVRATVRLEGQFAGRPALHFVARLCFFVGTGLVRLALTIHNPGRARHPGGLWDLGDRGSVLFRDLTLELRLRGPAEPLVTWEAEAGNAAGPAGEGPFELYQDSSGGENWQSRAHVNRLGRVPVALRGYRVRSAGDDRAGLRASPVVHLGGPGAGLSVAVPEFWQQFPKALEAEGRAVRVRLFPRQFGDLFELQGGEQKTHTVWFDFGPTAGPPESRLGWAHRPARVRAAPEWYAASGAVPYLRPRPVGPLSPMDAYIEGAVSGPDSVFAGREAIDEYGWRNYGEVYADHEALYYKGAPPVVSHYNNQYDVVYGTILQYLRTGDPRWADLFGPLARHVTDIDIYHTDRDRAGYNGGMFWHTDHYRDAATCTHRAYSRANRRAGAPYGGGPSNEHNYTTGLLHYHYLTGSPAAREAVIGLADWVVGVDDGARTVLGVVDDGPTGLASSTTRPDYHGPGRGAGNSVNALLDGWLLTGRRGYLEKAEALIRRCVHPADDVAARDLLNVELRWSYTVFLSALARYLAVKAEQGELDVGYSYARASLLRYAGWMAEYEEPYFAHPEKLEYPTETWAAQEFRKANVLRLAAAHADETLRPRLLRRADELAGRGWEDLLRCRPSATARARAILFVEGTRDDYFRAKGVAPAPAPAGEYDFGLPEEFVPQRQRVLARLKSARGLAGALWRLAGPRRWRRWASRRRAGPPAGGQAC